MKTTLIIPDPVFRALKQRAVERGETMSNLATELLRRGLAEKPETKELPPLPIFDGMGEPLVDLHDPEAMYRVLDAERDARLYGPQDGD
jgi:hypothetical protein